jgi:DNA-binding response OmpR family regulator
MSKILIVEDEPVLRETLAYNVQREGHQAITAADGRAALDLARRQRPDLIVLDLMLPELSGIDVCRTLRREGMLAPILMLTARDQEIDKVVGLEVGADDYLTKPFSMRELLARIGALLRRLRMIGEQRSDRESLEAGTLSLDLRARRVHRDGVAVALKPKEFDLLAFFLRNPGRVWSREQLLEQVWGYDYPGDTRTVDVHMRWLRQKIETDPSEPRYLQTVRGAGYRFEA